MRIPKSRPTWESCVLKIPAFEHPTCDYSANHPNNRMPTYTKRPFSALVLLLTLLVAAGCESLEYRPEAVGREGDVIVVTDSSTWNGELGEAIRGNVAPYLGTLPAPERAFNLQRMTLTSNRIIETIQKQKNILFVAPLSDSTREAEFLRTRLDAEALEAVQNGSVSIIPRRDLWRSGQQVIYVFGQTPEAIIAELNARGSDIQYQFNDITRQRVEVDMFEKGRQFDMEQAILDKHDFRVKVQHDYFSAIDTTNFVWLRRVIDQNSWRSLFVYYIDDFNPANLNPNWIHAARDRLTETYIQGNLEGFVTIDYRRELNTENIDFLGRFGFETRGLWHMVERDDDGDLTEWGMGGPFVNYTFYDDDSRRLYMIDGMVFAPGYDKREFLRHMETIAHTFQNANEVMAAETRSNQEPAE